jgi:shikimate kinase
MPTVILIGPPGAGKSSVAKSLAKLLDLKHADTDHIIEKELGKKISEIFVDEGEEYFRKVEADVVRRALIEEPGVLSLGGGAILDPQTQAAISSSEAPVIFLDVSISQAGPRVGFNKDRPLLLINPRQQWLALMEKRRPIYETLSDQKISTDNKKATEVAAEIVQYLGQR